MTTPKGYSYVEIEVTDPEGYRANYMTRSTPAVAKFGGRFVVRGGDVTVKNGDLTGRRVVLVEFDSYERALEFYESPDYREAMAHRDRHAIVHRYVIMRGAA
jgi:uncharacterized protein (DUF1330 family)